MTSQHSGNSAGHIALNNSLIQLLIVCTDKLLKQIVIHHRMWQIAIGQRCGPCRVIPIAAETHQQLDHSFLFHLAVPIVIC